MTLSPIVDRELRVASRLAATYRNRTLAGAAMTLAAFCTLAWRGFPLPATLPGAQVFRVLSVLALAYCVLAGAIKTADCLSSEKREGTLGLLFLTDLKGYDIVLGKLAATSLSSFYGLAAALPLLAIGVLVGGVTGAEFWRVVLSLLNVLFFSLCVGMFISSLARNEQFALGCTLLTVAAVVVLPLLVFSPVALKFFPVLARGRLLFLFFTPAYGYHAAFATVYPRASVGYWVSLVLTQLLGWTLLAGAAWFVPRVREEGRTRARKTNQRRPIDAAERERLRPLLLGANPVLWLAARGSGPRLELRILMALGAGSALVFALSRSFQFVYYYLAGSLLLNLIFKMYVGAEACRLLADGRRENTLETLFSSPLTVRQIIYGQALAMKRIFLVPAAALLAVEIVGLLIGSGFARNTLPADQDSFITIVVVGLGYIGCFYLDFFALMWAGTWFGLTSRTKNRAVSKTVLMVLILPLGTVLVPCFGLVFYFVWPVLWSFWANARLESSLRALAPAGDARDPAADRRWPGAEPIADGVPQEIPAI